ncbi:MAG: DNA-3-methyladenine glycosylase 2 family protein [Acidimicrobiales bacterium]|nr:DNA-3-methyladenine glycosylase 2 family protein [Acidimicrobiales bacterium]
MTLVPAAVLDGPSPGSAPLDLRRLSHDILGATRLAPDGRTLWWATHTPQGPATLRVEARHPGRAPTLAVWGQGAAWMADQAPRVLGGADDPAAFRPPAGIVGDLWRRHGPVTIGRTDRVFDAALEAVLGQKVQTVLAKRALRRMSMAIGEVAPGPLPMRLYPHPDRLAALGSFELHRFGVERKRAETVQRVAREASRLERAAAEGIDALDRRLLSIRGVGVWTSALVRTAAVGDADAVPVGDYHVAPAVVWALTGRPRGSDEEMVALLEPFRPHRGRVVALLLAHSGAAPRFGPRLEALPVDRLDRPGAWSRDRGPTGGGYRDSPLGRRSAR